MPDLLGDGRDRSRPCASRIATIAQASLERGSCREVARSSQAASRKSAFEDDLDAEPGAAASTGAKQACAGAEVGARIAIGVEAPMNGSVEWPEAISS
ncbi:hypothetical protein [Pseudoxanthomonas kaohsiungensis]|uniref:Uncharacterized protein n=1 Tax=Pseudoxanthomonas kaohsiungensis TaxID=283923 RepID=A0ABW3LXA1_9GAMM|nr:hypothetical protein [Pseudoxanthomonas kaohsiungensis]